MSAIFIFHGAYGHPDENWYPSLKKELLHDGHTVIIPTFPTPEEQNLETWTITLEPYMRYLDENAILVGHSLGAAFILCLLENMNVKVKACVFVAGFIGKLNNPVFDDINASFTDRKFDWKKIRKNGSEFFIYTSDNDHLVSLKKAEELGKHLEAETILVKGAGHFNSSAGYAEFPQLLEKIREISRKKE